MRADSYPLAEAAASWAGMSISDEAKTTLHKYYDWLGTEAVAAGGIGPNEIQRIWSRHIADSLLFGIGLEESASCVDLGSGVGLPGIPLAITRPEISFDLVDRSGRRCDLMRRAIAVLGLSNCSVVHREIALVDKIYDSIVSRASLPTHEMMIHVKRLLGPRTIAILGVSRTSDGVNQPKSVGGLVTSAVAVPSKILDTPVQLLRIVAA